MKNYSLCILFCAVFTTALCQTDVKKNPFFELPCITMGGMCVKTDECPKDKLTTQKGLCPVQQKDGVECCYGVPRSETRCRGNGGECVSKSFHCAETLVLKKATDCAQDQQCCIFVTK